MAFPWKRAWPRIGHDYIEIHPQRLGVAALIDLNNSSRSCYSPSISGEEPVVLMIYRPQLSKVGSDDEQKAMWIGSSEVYGKVCRWKRMTILANQKAPSVASRRVNVMVNASN
jgi:hypothetical protein